MNIPVSYTIMGIEMWVYSFSPPSLSLIGPLTTEICYGTEKEKLVTHTNTHTCKCTQTHTHTYTQTQTETDTLPHPVDFHDFADHTSHFTEELMLADPQSFQ